MPNFNSTDTEISHSPNSGLIANANSYRNQSLTHSVIACLASAIVCIGSACAADISPGVGSGSVLKALLALTLVLVAVFGLAWLARKFSPAPHSGSWLRLRGGLAIGTRERVVIVEVNDTWLVVGVAPGQVNVLHTLPRPNEVLDERGTTNAPGNFSTWLANAMKRQTHA